MAKCLETSRTFDCSNQTHKLKFRCTLEYMNMGTCCGTVDKTSFASDNTGGRGFESSHRQSILLAE